MRNNFSFKEIIKLKMLNQVNDTYESYVIKFTSVVGYYVIPGFCIVGGLLNTLCLLVLLNSKFKERVKFKYLTLKVVVCLFECSLGVGFQNYLKCSLEFFKLSIQCTETGSFGFQLYRLIFFKWLAVSLYSFLGVNEIFLTYYSYLTIKNIRNWFNKDRSFKHIALVSILATLSINLPVFFAFEIKLVKNETNLFYLEQSSFGLSKFYSMYILFFSGIFNVILVVIVVIISLFVLNSYREFLKSKLRLNDLLNFTPLNILEGIKQTNSKRTLKKREIKMLKMTICLNVIYAVSRLFDTIVVFIYRLNNVKESQINKKAYLYLINLCYLVLYLVGGCNFFILYVFNVKFRKYFTFIFKKIFLFKIKNE